MFKIYIQFSQTQLFYFLIPKNNLSIGNQVINVFYLQTLTLQNIIFIHQGLNTIN